MIGLRFNTAAEALERVVQLRLAGWYVYRVEGVRGFCMTELDVDRYFKAAISSGDLVDPGTQET